MTDILSPTTHWTIVGEEEAVIDFTAYVRTVISAVHVIRVDTPFVNIESVLWVIIIQIMNAELVHGGKFFADA
jgi:hypothetical protein